jgi:alginate O-acetyltransferase complex protein AlgI
MQFYSVEFAIFFIFVILALIALQKQKFQHFFLIIASYVFYWSTSDIFLLILIFISLITFYAGGAIYRAENKARKRVILTLAVVVTLSFLGFFKYYNFGVENVNQLFAILGIDTRYSFISIFLPIGLSFYTFSGLSYVFDIYLGKIEPEEYFYKYALFISYFPHLLAGPIVRAGQFLPQLKNQIVITSDGIKQGITLIAWGFFKKILIADNIAPLVTATFADPQGLPSITIITGSILFGIQVYCDFSGYIDIALGCAQIIGLHLPENFNRPYFSKNITEFWRRWNITLSSFIKDYVYIPLGGNRKGKVRTYINLVASMVICGLWHGAGWNFVLWGGYNGVLLSLHKLIHNRISFGKRVDRVLETPRGLFIKILFTQYLFILGLVIFRSQNIQDIWYCFKKFLFIDFIFTPLEIIGIVIIIMSVVIFFILLQNQKFSTFIIRLMSTDWIATISGLKLSHWFVCLWVIILLLIMFSPSSSPEFIYFQF